MERCFSPPESASFVFVVNMIKVPFPYLFPDLRVSNYVSRQGIGINRKNESTKIIMKYCTVLYNRF